MELGKEVGAIGRLLGLLDSSGELDAKWFQNAAAQLEGIPGRLQELAALIGAVLGTPEPDAPPVFAGASWYPLPNPTLGTATAFHIVASPGTDAAGELGCGVLQSLGLGALRVETYAYVPLVGYDAAGATFIADSARHPSRIGVDVTVAGGGAPFAVDGVTFTGVTIEAEIFLADVVPTLTLTFRGLAGTDRPAVYHALADLLDPTVDAWLGELLVRGGTFLHFYAGNGTITVADLLTSAGFLQMTPAGAYELTLAGLRGLTPAQIALQLVFAVLDTLAAAEFPVVVLPGGGIYVAHRESTGDYGVRVAAELTLGGTPGADGKPGTAVDLCLGTWMTGEDDSSSWMQRATGTVWEPGLSVYLLRKRGTALSFAPGFTLVSAGLNVRGAGDAPLFSVEGVTLNGAELRAYLDSDRWAYGVAARLDGVGFPLGPGFATGGSGNAVAQNLLSRGTPPAGGGETPAVNPAFSAEAAWVKGHPPVLEIFDPQGDPTDLIWFPIQRQLGPLRVGRVGLRVDVTGDHRDDPVLGVVLDGGVQLGALDVTLDQLSVGVHLKDAADTAGYTLDLQGLDVTFAAGGVELSGGMLKTTAPGGGTEYDGEVVIRFGTLSVTALGSYATLADGATSLFIFGFLNEPLGGPACFFVTGLSAGFGYNRALRIPTQSEVQGFPLVAGLTDPAVLGGAQATPAQALASLQSWVPPRQGEYWLAAGVQFTTYEIINSNVLVAVEFGKELVFALLGVSTVRQPQAGETYVYAELDVDAVCRPDQGELSVSAVLAPSSYVLTPAAHLTGGFAFGAWWSPSEHAGDFVFTIGGYHPAFNVPAWYPQVPRVGINWQIDSRTSLVGGAYFALTPTAMMAGGLLAVTFAEGGLKAWLRAQADAILFWKPFYLIATASLSVGISYHVELGLIDLTLSLEIGATFELWGPPVGYKVHVDWYIISFTIGSGSPNPPRELSWDDFKGMLPTKTQSSPSGEMPFAAAEPVTRPAYLHINPVAGILRTLAVGGNTLWLVRPSTFRVEVGSAIPASLVVVESTAGGKQLRGLPVAMRGVNGGIPSAGYRCTQTVTLVKLAAGSAASIAACMATACSNHPPGCGGTIADTTGWNADPLVRALPQALWGDPLPAGQTPDINPATPTVDGTVGVTMYPAGRAIRNCTPPLAMAQLFAGRVVNADDEWRLPLSNLDRPCPDAPRAADTFAQIARAASPATARARAGLFMALGELGVQAWTDEPLTATAADPGLAFADEPMAGSPVCATLELA